MSLRRGVESIVDGPFGSNLASEHYVNEGARVVRLGNIGAMDFKSDDKAFVSLEHYEQLKRHAVRAGDVLVAGLGDERNAVGRTCIAPGDIEPALVKADCFRLRPRKSILLPRYVGWFLNSTYAAHLVEIESRGATRVRATPEAILRIDTPMPPIDEQQRIADFLDEQVARIDNITGARRAQTALTASAREAELVSLVLGGGDLGGTASSAWYRGLPQGWRVGPLRAAWQVIDCKHRTPDYVDNGYPVVSPGDISAAPLDLSRCHRFVDDDDYADLADALRRCRVGDIVYSRNASAGIAALVATESPFTMGQDVCRITSPRRSQAYLCYVLNVAVMPQLDAARVGSTFTRINIDEIKSLRVPIPTDADQQRIVRDIDRMVEETDSVLSAQRGQVALLDELKASLITAAVTGEFDVSSADGTRVPD